MKTLIRILVFAAIAASPVKLFSAPLTTLDQWLTPSEMAQELRLPFAKEPVIASRTPLTPEQVFHRYGVNVFAEFPVVIIINKASRGPSAQTMSVYHLGQLQKVFLTSTGREQWETAPSGKRYYTSTPVGWFRPQAFVEDHHSTIWDASMELSIFFNGGIAIHATTPDLYDRLGTRASGGCVRLTREDAQVVWDRTYKLPPKLVPIFNVEGRLKIDRRGRVQRRLGSGVLILVIDSRS